MPSAGKWVPEDGSPDPSGRLWRPVLRANHPHRGKILHWRSNANGLASVYPGPQLNFTWGEHAAAYLAADLPVVLNNTALQTVPDYRIRAGFGWHF